MKITKTQLRRIIKEELSTKRQCNCKEIKKAIENAYFQERAVSGQQPRYNIDEFVRGHEERCPECFREDEKTTQEPEAAMGTTQEPKAAMGPEGPIMKKTLQERNKTWLKQIIKEELEAIVKK